MKQEDIQQCKEAAKATYLFLLDVVDYNHSDKYNYREQVITALKSDDKDKSLKKLGMPSKLKMDIINATNAIDKENAFVSFLFLDWTNYFKHG